MGGCRRQPLLLVLMLAQQWKAVGGALKGMMLMIKAGSIANDDTDIGVAVAAVTRCHNHPAAAAAAAGKVAIALVEVGVVLLLLLVAVTETATAAGVLRLLQLSVLAPRA